MNRPKESGAPELPPAVVHLDLDGARHIYRVHGRVYEAGADSLFDTGLGNALDFFETEGIRATLFVIGEDLEDPPKLAGLREAVRRGHEIASHSLSHRPLTRLDTAEKRREIVESRERISNGLGVEVAGFRAPGFHVDRESLESIEAAGYAYDTSLFHSDPLIRTVGLALPGDGGARRLVELALPRHDPLPFPFHPCYSLVLGSWYFRLGMLRFRPTGLPLVVLFHLTDFAAPVPPEWSGGWRTRFYTLSFLSPSRKLRGCRRMIGMVRRRYRLTDTVSLLGRTR